MSRVIHPNRPGSGDGSGGIDYIPWGDVSIEHVSGLDEHKFGASESGLGLSLILSLAAECQGSDKTMCRTRAATIAIPVRPQEGQPLDFVKFDIRGNVTKKAGARAVLFVDMMGTAHEYEFPFGQEMEGKEFTFTIGTSDLPVTAGGGRLCVLSFFLAVQRMTTDDYVGLFVDTVDAELFVEPPSKKG